MSLFSNIGATFAQASRQFGSADAAERSGTARTGRSRRATCRRRARATCGR